MAARRENKQAIKNAAVADGKRFRRKRKRKAGRCLVSYPGVVLMRPDNEIRRSVCYLLRINSSYWEFCSAAFIFGIIINKNAERGALWVLEALLFKSAVSVCRGMDPASSKRMLDSLRKKVTIYCSQILFSAQVGCY